MYHNKRVSDIKRAQRASLLLRTISKLFVEASLDNPAMQTLYVNRIEMSPDKSYCYVYFGAHGGQAEYDAKFHDLKLYKPSLRAALAKNIRSRYTAEIVFKFDETEEKARRIDQILHDLKEKGEL